MTYLGDFSVGATVYVPFNTFDAAGASVTITGFAVTDIEIYKDGGTTQRASDNGYTLLDTDGIDFDGITGIHGFKVDLSDNSDAGFFAAGHDYFVVISAITVDGKTVNFVAASFSIRNRSDAASPWDDATSGHTATGTYGDKLGAHLKGVLKVIIGAGSSTTDIVLNSSTGIDGAPPSSTNDFYNGRVIIFTSGTLAGQATDITDYMGSTVTLTVTSLTGAPASGDTAVIV